MEYSPRPWEARYEDLAYTIYAADEYDIALVACYPAELEQANARLIAAAPSMLEALVAARELIATFLLAGNPDEHIRQLLEILKHVCNDGLSQVQENEDG